MFTMIPSSGYLSTATVATTSASVCSQRICYFMPNNSSTISICSTILCDLLRVWPSPLTFEDSLSNATRVPAVAPKLGHMDVPLSRQDCFLGSAMLPDWTHVNLSTAFFAKLRRLMSLPPSMQQQRAVSDLTKSKSTGYWLNATCCLNEGKNEGKDDDNEAEEVPAPPADLVALQALVSPSAPVPNLEAQDPSRVNAP